MPTHREAGIRSRNSRIINSVTEDSIPDVNAIRRRSSDRKWCMPCCEYLPGYISVCRWFIFISNTRTSSKTKLDTIQYRILRKLPKTWFKINFLALFYYAQIGDSWVFLLLELLWITIRYRKSRETTYH